MKKLLQFKKYFIINLTRYKFAVCIYTAPIYKINNLVKTKQKPTLNYSQNSVKIGFIDKDEYIKITGYEISEFNFKLQIQQNTTLQDNSTSYVMIDEKDILINDISKQDKAFLESYNLKIVSINESISEDNKNECYIIEEYKHPYSPDGINIIKSTHLVVNCTMKCSTL